MTEISSGETSTSKITTKEQALELVIKSLEPGDFSDKASFTAEEVDKVLSANLNLFLQEKILQHFFRLIREFNGDVLKPLSVRWYILNIVDMIVSILEASKDFFHVVVSNDECNVEVLLRMAKADKTADPLEPAFSDHSLAIVSPTFSK